ncbi:hypothetical protein BLNAU_11838 [Blattamonas nauphoetae]|uniref:Protein kinase domain-containing protein n=1 Tax=Blattamonas nauphoetae TaxID=2049346 RepID=A0ABQ9XLA3_9EUKA|nr:hypothetical protein BLNAU_11838 [Blattamonas nauphoetae]
MKDTGAAELIPDTNGLSITGHGMEYLSNVFPLGTGPLFDFRTHPRVSGEAGLDCCVSLTSTSFRNSTSEGSPRTQSGHSATLIQRMIGCSMSHSTNHLSGTSGMNLNWRGSSLLVNSSFSTCVTNTDLPQVTEPSFPSDVSSYQYYTSHSDRIAFNATSVLNNRVYVDSCTFTALESSNSGAAISLHDVGADIWIKKSTFRNCQATNGEGGGIFISHNGAGLYNTGSIEIFGCAFTNCTCRLSGGHVSLAYFQSGVIAECIFKDFWIHPHLANDLLTDSFHISTNYFVRFHNSTFARNKGYRVGGLAVNAYGLTPSVVLSDLLYHENECVHQTESSKLSDCATNAVLKIQALDCFSTSFLPRSGQVDGINRFPSLVGPSILKVVMTEKLNDAKDGFLLEISFEGMFTGTSRKYSVALEDTNNNNFRIEGLSFGRTASESFSRPLLLTSAEETFKFNASFKIVSMEKAATTASNDYDVGEGPEPEWSLWYHATTSKFGNLIPMSFTTPLPPTLTKITSTLDTTNLNAVNLTLTINKVLGGDFKLIVTDTSDSSGAEIDLGTYSFEPSVAESSQSKPITIYPTGKLAYGKSYRIKTLESPTLPIVHSSRTFTVPVGPARIFSAVGSLSGTNETFVTITMTGERLPAGRSVVIEVQERKGEVVNPDADKISLSGTFPGLYGFITEFSLDIEIYNQTETMEYGKSYKIVSLTANGLKGVADPTAVFEVHPSPSRIEGTSSRVLDDAKTEVTVTVNGVGFTNTITSISVKGSTQAIAAKSVTLKSATVLEIVVPAGRLESSTTVEFGKEYVIESVTTSDSKTVYINSGVKFSVPVPSIVTGITPLLVADTNIHFTLSVTGTDFEAGSKWNVLLDGFETKPILIEMTSQTSGKSEKIKAGGLSEIQFGSTYAIKSIVRFDAASVHLVSAVASIAIPAGPTLTDVTANLNVDDLNEVILTLSMSRAAAQSLTLVVVDTLDVSESPIEVGSVIFALSTASVSKTMTVQVYGGSKLKYGKTYKVKSLSSTQLVVAHSPLTFEVPAAPARIVTAVGSLTGLNETFATISMNGQALPAGKSFSIVVQEMDGDAIKAGAALIPLSGTIEGSIGITTTCSLSKEIYQQAETMEYGKKYKIVSLIADGKTGITDATAHFEVPKSPGRVEATSDPRLNDAKTEVTVTVNGVGFTNTITSISVKRLTQTIAAKSVTLKSATVLEIVVPAGRLESSTTVEFGKKYVIESVTTSDSKTVYINSGVKFSVPLAPIVSSPFTTLNTTTNLHFKLSVSCANFQSGSKWNVFLQGRTQPILIEIGTSLTGESDWVKAGGNGELQFDSTYVITSITLHGSPAVHALFTDASFTTPKGPTLTSISNASVSLSDSNSVSMTLVGKRMPSALFTIQVVEVGQSSATHTLDGSFSSSENGKIDVEVRGKNTIKYGKVYQIETVSNDDVVVALPSTLTFEVPVFLTQASSALNVQNNEEVFVSVSGFGFPPSTNFDLTIVQVNDQNTAIGQSFTVGSKFSQTPSNGDISTHRITTTVETGKLEHGKKYKITSFDISSKSTAIEQDLVFDVLSPPTLTSIALIPSGNSKRVFKLEVNGTDLPQGETFVVKLKEYETTFEILVESLLSGSSSEIGLGFTDTLQFSTTYHLDKATLKSDPAISPAFSPLSFNTEAQPHPLILFADTTTHSDPLFCGDSNRPCSSIDVAWKIVQAFSATQIQLKIPLATTLSSPIAISEMMTVSLERGGVQTATLSIPPTSTGDSNNVLISIAGTIEIEHVNINVAASSHDFILLDVSSGSLSMKVVTLSRVMAEVLPIESLEELCSWETGLIRLSNSDVTVHTTVFSGFEMGVFWMEGSNLTLSFSSFGQNGQRTSFPSARQNIRCEGGVVSITQNAESNANTSHQWISSENCEVSLNTKTLPAPLFVPSLDAKNSKTTFDKKQSQFTVGIVGSMLIPCDISLEVFSITPSSSTSNDDTKSVVLPLSFDQTSHWSEDNLSLIIPSSSLALLSPTLQWEARLLFAGNQSTASFLFQLNSKEKMAQLFKASLPWFIPLVISIVVLLLAIIVIIIVCLHRRKNNAKEAKSKSHLAEEFDQEIAVKYDDGFLDYQTTNNIIELKDDEDGRHALAQNNYPSTELPVPEMEESKEDTPMLIPVTALRCEGDFPVVVVDGVNTLYQRIHHGNKITEMKKKEMGSRIAAGLIRMVEDKVHLGAAARLTPHWVVVDKNDSIHLRIEEPQNTPTQNPSDLLTTHNANSQIAKAPADGIEGIRWRAPEEGEKESEVNENVDKVKVSVFRLGLVLWEIETELVPFGEIDAVSAHRQLACGVELQFGRIRDSSIRELISQCLHVEPEQRPTLKDIFSTLETSMKNAQKQAVNSHLLNLQQDGMDFDIA